MGCKPRRPDPSRLDEQWLVSLAHKQSDMDKLVESFRELAIALRS